MAIRITISLFDLMICRRHRLGGIDWHGIFTGQWGRLAR